ADETANGDDLAAKYGDAHVVEALRHRGAGSIGIARGVVFFDDRHGVAADIPADHENLLADSRERDFVAWTAGQRLLQCPASLRCGCLRERRGTGDQQAAQRERNPHVNVLHLCLPTQIHPCNSRRTRCAITRMPASLSLRQGMAANFSPPLALKICAFSTAISSNVSRQSAEKPGVTTARFFTPLRANASTVLSV